MSLAALSLTTLIAAATLVTAALIATALTTATLVAATLIAFILRSAWRAIFLGIAGTTRLRLLRLMLWIARSPLLRIPLLLTFIRTLREPFAQRRLLCEFATLRLCRSLRSFWSRGRGNRGRVSTGSAKPIGDGTAQEAPFVANFATGQSLFLEQTANLSVFDLQVGGSVFQGQHVQFAHDLTEIVIVEELLDHGTDIHNLVVIIKVFFVYEIVPHQFLVIQFCVDDFHCGVMHFGRKGLFRDRGGVDAVFRLYFVVHNNSFETGGAMGAKVERHGHLKSPTEVVSRVA